ARHPPGGGKSSGQRRSGRHVRYLARSIERADLSEGRRYGPGGAVEHPVAGTRHARTPALQARGGAAGPRRGPDPVASPRHPGGGAGPGADPAHRGTAGRRGRRRRRRAGDRYRAEPGRAGRHGRRTLVGPVPPAPHRVPRADRADHRAVRHQPRSAHRGPAGGTGDDDDRLGLRADLRQARPDRVRGTAYPTHRRGDVMSTFSSLSGALSALYSQQRGMDVTGQNIANANTDGYSRQRVDLKSVGGSPVPAMNSLPDPSSGGVTVTGVERVQDAFLEARGRIEHAQNSYLADQNQVFTEVQQAFNEPSDTGVQSQLSDVWSA